MACLGSGRSSVDWTLGPSSSRVGRNGASLTRQDQRYLTRSAKPSASIAADLRVRTGQDVERIEHVLATIRPPDSHAPMVSLASSYSLVRSAASRGHSGISIAVLATNLPRMGH